MGKLVEKAVLLIPHPDYSNPLASGSAPISENIALIFEKSILVRDGVYTSVEETEHYINVSRKLAMHARKTQSYHWQTQGLKVSGRGYVKNKDARRYQLGYKTYSVMLKDLVKGSARGSILLINDFLAGVGELGVAAVHARVSQEANDAGVTISYWGCEVKKTLLEIAKANINTTIWGKCFLISV